MSFQDLESGRPLAQSRRDYINAKQDPTQAVASGIFQINTAVSTFQRLVNTLGTPKDTSELREKLHVPFVASCTSALGDFCTLKVAPVYEEEWRMGYEYCQLICFHLLRMIYDLVAKRGIALGPQCLKKHSLG
ncbi:Syntaxin-22 [Vitis vinifera]|uniref:Syntaxin-22 n=1 Tax=Vitis vinifera TaxID=29760 RepID=A0A438JZM5_VITVI|nr:Syntaxin-22 [Vitis vinifera]